MTGWLQRCVLSDDETLEIRFGEDGWRLAYLRGGEVVLAYEGDQSTGRRIGGGRRSAFALPRGADALRSGAYALRSVEQLRYDFERELVEMRRERGAAAAAPQ